MQIREAVLEVLFLKNNESGDGNVCSKAIPVSIVASVDCPMKRDIEEILQFGINFAIYQ